MITDLIKELESFGCKFEIIEGQLIVRGGGKLPAPIVEKVREQKPMIISFLESPKPTVSYYKGVETIYDQAAYDAYLARNGYERR